MNSEFIVLVISGGKEEAEISKISASFITKKLDKININYETTCLNDYSSLNVLIQQLPTKFNPEKTYVIPCIHGAPGESGEIQALLSEAGYSYLGCDSDSSMTCFDKITTKLKTSKLGIPIVPFQRLKYETKLSTEHIRKVHQFFNDNGRRIFIKSPRQGSSIGCYEVRSPEEIEVTIKKCSAYGHEILIEKAISGREIEVATFEFKQELHISDPGEILTEGEFYNYDNKYSEKSKVKASISPTIDEKLKKQLCSFCAILFRELGLKDLSRIDFFLENETNKIYLNEINTFPGMTPISLFPLLVEGYGVKFEDFLKDRLIQNNLEAKGKIYENN